MMTDFCQEEKMPDCSCPLGIKATFYCDQSAEKCPARAKGQVYYCVSCIEDHTQALSDSENDIHYN